MNAEDDASPRERSPGGLVLVAGASGYVGSRLIPELLRRGRRVRALVRDPRKIAAKPWGKAVEVAEADVSKPRTLEPALRGVDVAYYLVHSLGAADGSFEARDVAAAASFSRAAKEAGVRRIVYLGGLGSERDELSPHLRSRHETGDALRSGGVPTTELRAAIVVGAGSASFEIVRDLARRLPIMICPKWVRSKCEPIAIRQVIAYLAGVLDDPETSDGVFEIGGGEVKTYESMMRECAEVMGRKLRILVVPVLTPRLSSYWLNLVTSVPFSVARPLVEGLRNDVVVRDRTLARRIAAPVMTYREAVAEALAEGADGSRLASRWTGASRGGVREGGVRADAKTFFDRRVVLSSASPRALFDRVRRIGGEAGWPYADGLWRLRGFFDRLLGGPGMRVGRDHPSEIAIGDAIDFWRVEDSVEGRTLLLRAEMKVPGTARLRFEVAPRDGGSTLTQTAEFEPSGVWGRLYWYALVPLHAIVFGGTARRLAAAAEAARAEEAR
jgi:uncharacterized protein YbjT (DUF2867 family)